MTIRPAPLVTTLALAALVLAGCAPTPTPAPTPVDSTTPTPVETETPVAQLPDDAVLGLSLHATATNGAEVDIQLVLLKPEPIGSDAAAPRAAATATWCEGEVDQSIFESESGYSFAQLDVTVTPVAGTAAWPSDLPLHILPGGGGPTLAPGGAAYAVERPDDSGADDPAYYVPHCQQDAFLAVPGTGSVYLGWGNDGTSLTAWIGTEYGATFDQWGEPIGDPPVLLTNCTTVITELGKSMGGNEQNLIDFFSDSQCIVVGNTP